MGFDPEYRHPDTIPYEADDTEVIRYWKRRVWLKEERLIQAREVAVSAQALLSEPLGSRPRISEAVGAPFGISRSSEKRKNAWVPCNDTYWPASAVVGENICCLNLPHRSSPAAAEEARHSLSEDRRPQLVGGLPSSRGFVHGRLEGGQVRHLDAIGDESPTRNMLSRCRAKDYYSAWSLRDFQAYPDGFFGWR